MDLPKLQPVRASTLTKPRQPWRAPISAALKATPGNAQTDSGDNNTSNSEYSSVKSSLSVESSINRQEGNLGSYSKLAQKQSVISWLSTPSNDADEKSLFNAGDMLAIGDRKPSSESETKKRGRGLFEDVNSNETKKSGFGLNAPPKMGFGLFGSNYGLNDEKAIGSSFASRIRQHQDDQEDQYLPTPPPGFKDVMKKNEKEEVVNLDEYMTEPISKKKAEKLKYAGSGKSTGSIKNLDVDKITAKVANKLLKPSDFNFSSSYSDNNNANNVFNFSSNNSETSHSMKETKNEHKDLITKLEVSQTESSRSIRVVEDNGNRLGSEASLKKNVDVTTKSIPSVIALTETFTGSNTNDSNKKSISNTSFNKDENVKSNNDIHKINSNEISNSSSANTKFQLGLRKFESHAAKVEKRRQAFDEKKNANSKDDNNDDDDKSFARRIQGMQGGFEDDYKPITPSGFSHFMKKKEEIKQPTPKPKFKFELESLENDFSKCNISTDKDTGDKSTAKLAESFYQYDERGYQN